MKDIKISPVLIYSFLKDINFNLNKEYENILFNNKEELYNKKIVEFYNLFDNNKIIPLEIYILIMLSFNNNQLCNFIRFLNIKIGTLNLKIEKCNLNEFKENKNKMNFLFSFFKIIKNKYNYFFILNNLQEYLYC